LTHTPDDLLQQLAEPGPVALDCSRYPRLSTAFILAASKRPQGVRLLNASSESRWALSLLGLSGMFSIVADETIQARDLPFQVGMDATATIVVAVDRAAAINKRLYDPAAHSWGRGLATATIIVDFAAVDMVNSVLVAWLLQLAQASRPAAMLVRHARSLIATQFKQLRLDQMMTIE
jgi:hypothetical protein